MSIALDAMGGDHAPEEVVKGALEAAPNLKGDLLLVGQADKIEPLLGTQRPSNIKIVSASQVVTMDDKPLDSYRKKKDSSLHVGAKLVKDGVVDAFVSAGNTGAVSATTQLIWRNVLGIHRPAIGSQMPNLHDGFLLLDSGASPDVDPIHLLEFAVMGRAYAQSVMGKKEPSVHLLNIGEEEGKGNHFAKEVYKLLQPFPWFRGNIEGKDIYHKQCDVVVCDAFVGNIVLKTSEGVAEFITKMIRDQVPKNKLMSLPYLPMRKIMQPLRKKIDYAEIGGSPLLGLNGLCTICHGRSSAKAIRNALFQTQKAIDNDLVGTIRTSVARDLEGQSPLGSTLKS